MYFVIFTTDRADHLDLRLTTRASHRAYVRDMAAHPDVKVIHGGPTLAADGETMNGTMLLVEGPSLGAVQTFADGDPYRQANLFADVQIRPWVWGIGQPEKEQ